VSFIIRLTPCCLVDCWVNKRLWSVELIIMRWCRWWWSVRSSSLASSVFSLHLLLTIPTTWCIISGHFWLCGTSSSCRNIRTSHFLAFFVMLRSEIPSGMCAKLRTVAASNNREYAPRSLYYCLFALRIYYRVFFFAHIVFVVNRAFSAQRQWSGCNSNLGSILIQITIFSYIFEIVIVFSIQ